MAGRGPWGWGAAGVKAKTLNVRVGPGANPHAFHRRSPFASKSSPAKRTWRRRRGERSGERKGSGPRGAGRTRGPGGRLEAAGPARQTTWRPWRRAIREARPPTPAPSAPSLPSPRSGLLMQSPGGRGGAPSVQRWAAAGGRSRLAPPHPRWPPPPRCQWPQTVTPFLSPASVTVTGRNRG